MMFVIQPFHLILFCLRRMFQTLDEVYLWVAATGTVAYGNNKREDEDQNITGEKDIDGHIHNNLIDRETVVIN